MGLTPKMEIKSLFEKLNNSNYSIWSLRMKSQLVKEGLWKSVQKRTLEKGDEENDQKALASIMLMIDDEQINIIAECETGYDAWEKLKNFHQKSSIGSKTRLYRRLFGSKIQVGGDMVKHLQYMSDIVRDLTSIGVKLDDDLVASAILASLSSEYDGLVTALEAWKESDLTPDNVKSKLLDEYDRRKEQTNQVQEQQLYKVNARSDVECYHCHKKGHIKKNCKLLNYSKENKDDKAKSAKAFSVDKWYKDRVHSIFSRWYVDSGATAHMTNDKSLFSLLDESFRSYVTVASGEKLECIGRGNIIMYILTKGGMRKIEMEDVLYVPRIDSNLVSVSVLIQKGFKMIYTSEGCFIDYGDGVHIHIGNRYDGMFVINAKVDCSMKPMDVGCNRADKCCVHVWHRKLAHRNLHDILAMKNHGLEIAKCDCSDICESCIIEKMTRKPFPKKATPVDKPLDCVVSDICGPMPILSVGGFRYFLTFTDVFSKYCAVYLLKSKEEVKDKVIEHLEYWKNKYDKKVKIFRSDRGTEYMSEKVQSYLRAEGIQFQCTVAYSPEQNGISERKNRTLVESCRAMLTESKMPREFWDEAILNANYTLNRVLSKGDKETPYEKFTGMKWSGLEFGEFGSTIYVKIPDQKRKKLDHKAIKYAFVGYDVCSKGYRVADMNRKKIFVARDVVFVPERFMKYYKNERVNETEYVLWPFSSSVQIEEKELEEVNGEINQQLVENISDNNSEIFFDADAEDMNFDIQPLDDIGSQNFDDVVNNSQENEHIENNLEHLPESEENQIQEELRDDVGHGLRQSARENKGKKPNFLDDYFVYSSRENFEPKTYNQATKCPDADKWKSAMEDEIRSICKNKTWDLVDLPKNKKAIGCKWVYKLKLDENGRVSRYKARLVAQGFSQKYGEDYDEVFAPVARSATFRVLMSIAGVKGYCVRQFDIKTAFLYGDIEEEIYMKQPQGFTIGDKVCKLKKSLYGLKQSARAWNKVLNDAVVGFGFIQNEVDKCFYTFKRGNNICYIIVHVDDILVVSNNEKVIDDFKFYIGKLFEMKDLGNVKHFLGIDVDRDEEGNFSISQSQYIASIVEDSGLNDGKTSKFPLMPGYFRHKDESYLESNSEYRKLIGKLLYVSTNTRPDIAASVGILSQKISKPTKTDLIEVRRVIRYLNGTKDLKLKLSSRTKTGELEVYSDASWAENPTGRKSISGFCINLNGGTVIWCSRKQDIVALSSMESEYIALTESCKELKWVRMLMKSFYEFSIPETIVVFTDSQSSMKLISNQKFSNRSKHIDTKYHFIRDLVEAGDVKLEYCSTEENNADMLTKPLGAIKIGKLRKKCKII